VRLALGDVVTNEDLREHLDAISRQLDVMREEMTSRPEQPRGRRAVG
jgi:hypothetical protein